MRRIDDAQLRRRRAARAGAKDGPKGTAAGQRDSNLLRFSVIDDSDTVDVVEEGRRRDHPRRATSDRTRRASSIGTVVRTVDAGGAIARDAELRPVVDLDALTFVKVLKYPPVPVP